MTSLSQMDELIRLLTAENRLKNITDTEEIYFRYIHSIKYRCRFFKISEQEINEAVEASKNHPFKTQRDWTKIRHDISANVHFRPLLKGFFSKHPSVEEIQYPNDIQTGQLAHYLFNNKQTVIVLKELNRKLEASICNYGYDLYERPGTASATSYYCVKSIPSEFNKNQSAYGRFLTMTSESLAKNFQHANKLIRNTQTQFGLDQRQGLLILYNPNNMACDYPPAGKAIDKLLLSMPLISHCLYLDCPLTLLQSSPLKRRISCVLFGDDKDDTYIKQIVNPLKDYLGKALNLPSESPWHFEGFSEEEINGFNEQYKAEKKQLNESLKLEQEQEKAADNPPPVPTKVTSEPLIDQKQIHSAQREKMLSSITEKGKTTAQFIQDMYYLIKGLIGYSLIGSALGFFLDVNSGTLPAFGFFFCHPQDNP